MRPIKIIATSLILGFACLACVPHRHAAPPPPPPHEHHGHHKPPKPPKKPKHKKPKPPRHHRHHAYTDGNPAGGTYYADAWYPA